MDDTRSIRRLLVAAVLVNSILASGNVNRGLIDMPAWQHVGPLGWAAFSRYADLGPTAMVMYPIEAFSGMLLSVLAAVLLVRRRHEARFARVPIYAGALLTLGGLAFTAKAAPIMLSVRHLDGDRSALQQALNGFQFWGGVRGICQVLAFLANVWALVGVSRAGSLPLLAETRPNDRL